MKLDKLELSALLGMQARNRELMFMMEQIKAQLEQLNDESLEFFSDLELRLKLEPDTIQNYDVDIESGELVPKSEETQEKTFGEFLEDTKSKTSSNGFHTGVTELKDVD